MIQLQHILAFCLYFTILLTIALFARKKIKSEHDYISGDRSLSFWVTSLSAHASDMSSWLFMAFPMLAYTKVDKAIWIAIGLLLGMFFCWQFVAPILRIKSEEYNALTISSYLARHFQDNKMIISKLSAIIMIFYLTIYLASGLIGMGLLFETLFEIDYHIGITICIFFVMLYTSIGGFIAVAWTDFFQAIFLLAMLFIVLFFAAHETGTTLQTISQKISINSLINNNQNNIYDSIVQCLSWGLGYLGMPHILNKFMSIKKANDIQKSKILGLTWQLLSLTTSFLIGIIAITYFKHNIDNPELIFIQMVKDLFHPFFAGIILCAVLAATISTMDSQVIVVSSLLTENFYKKIDIKKARINLILILAFTYIVAFGKTVGVLNAVSYAWNGLGCSIGPVVFSSLFLKNIRKEGVIVGLLSGTVLSIILPYFINIPPMIPGFCCNLIIIIFISKIMAVRNA